MPEYISNKKIRINKFLSDIGYASRREADNLIKNKKIKVNGKIALIGQILNIGDKIYTPNKELIYKVYYKPRGEITNNNKKELINLQPIGKLDKNSEGLLIYTNDYKLNQAILDPENHIEKEYKILIREKATPRVARILLSGIKTQETTYKPVKNIIIDENKNLLTITLIENKKHEIRRMLNALNLTILSLKRIRIANIKLNNLKKGESRLISKIELKNLFKTLKLK